VKKWQSLEGGGDTVEHDGQEIVEENILLYDFYYMCCHQFTTSVPTS